MIVGKGACCYYVSMTIKKICVGDENG